jgi:hypothetical protein
MSLIKEKPEEVLRCPAILCPFHLLCYANLKKYVFDHHFSFPKLSTKWDITETSQADPTLVKAVEEYILDAQAEQRGFFVVVKTKDGWSTKPLSFLASKSDDKVCMPTSPTDPRSSLVI